MASFSRKITFDTSGINKLWEDPDSVAIIRAMGLLYWVGITETVISEVIATEHESERRALLDVFKRLLNCSHALQLDS